MIKDRLDRIKEKIQFKKGQREQVLKAIETLDNKIKIQKRYLYRYDKAMEIVRQVGLMTQKQLEYHLSEQVSLALASVFDDPYKLKVVFQEKRGKTEAELLFERRGLTVRPFGAVGGGAIDVAALALRLAYLSMRVDKKVRPILFLDEPFARLKGEDANRRALMLIREISRKLKVQIVMISDERIPREDIIENADRVFLVTQKKGVSSVECL